MLETDRKSCEYFRDYKQVTTFLRRVWYHPLLTEATIKHRARFPEMFNDFCDKWEIDINNVVAGPIGSSVWIVSETNKHRSDWDFVLYFKDKEDHKIYSELRWVKMTKPITPDMHTIGGGSLEQCDPKGQFYLAAPLFFISDEFLVGNLEIAKQIRLHIVNLYDSGVSFDVPKTHTPLKVEFNKIKNWYVDNHPERVQLQLDLCAKEFAERHGGSEMLYKRYKQTFIRNLTNFKSPEDEIFFNAVRFSGGNLSSK